MILYAQHPISSTVNIYNYSALIKTNESKYTTDEPIYICLQVTEY